MSLKCKTWEIWHIYFLGMKFVNRKYGVFLHKKKYIEYILKKFRMSNCNLEIAPMETNIKLKNE